MGKIILGGRYIIENEIGAGGMAIVYKAHDKFLNRTVAIKVLRPEFKQDEEFIKRFDIEAKAAAGLNHPNIVAIHDVGVHEGLHYIVMEYVEGVTLKKLIAKNGKLPWQQALKIARQISSALTEAHAHAVIHRDIKPQNIMVTETGSVKVMDFGIARAASASTMTLGSKILGSAHYLSPEQARGGFMDERSDLYSLGVCLYEMITGRVPFDADTTVAVAMQHLQKQPTAPSTVVEDLPSSVEYIILKAMRKEQVQRYASARLMESDIIRVLADPSAKLQESAGAAFYSTKQMEAINDTDGTADTGTAEKKINRRTWLFIGLGAAALLLVLILGLTLLFGTGKKIRVPNLKGLTKDQAVEMLTEKCGEGIRLREKLVPVTEEGEIGKIIRQNPEGDQILPGSREIEVEIGEEPAPKGMKDYVGKTLREAEREAKELGFTCKNEEETDNSLNAKYKKGMITRQVPEAGTEAPVGSTIKFFVSKGKEGVEFTLSDYCGKNADTSRRAAEELGLSCEIIEETDSELLSQTPKDAVSRQSPASGTVMHIGDKLTLYRSTGGAAIVPQVTGMELSRAQATLTEAGYANIEVRKEASGEAADTVLRQSIEGGTAYETGGKILLTVSSGKPEVAFTLPSEPAQIRVKVIRKDNGATVYSRQHAAGETVHVEVSGKVEIYLDDSFWKEMVG